MALRSIGTIAFPPHRGSAGFDHASVDRRADRLYVAHTANDAIEVIALDRRVHEATLQGFPGVAGAAVWEERGLLAATCRGEATLALARVDKPATIRRIRVAERPNGLALVPRTGVALAACIGGDSTGPSLSMVDMDRGAVVATAALPGRPRWTVYDESAGCFYLNIAAPAQILVVAAAPPFDIVRSIAIPVAGPHGLDLDRRRGLLYCACDAGAVVTVEAASGRLVAQVPIAGAPDVVFFNERRERLYVAMGNPGVLQSIDTGGRRVVETMATGNGAHTFGFDSEREHVYALLPDIHAAAIFAEA
jgi:DNA-binding beta-propeller fold protein YncE